TGYMWGAARGVTVACVVADLVVYFAHPVKGFPLPRSIAVLDWLILLAFVAGTRLIARSLIERPGAASLVARGKEVIVVGAGDAAQHRAREGSDRRGRGRCRAARDPRDAEVAGPRLHADRSDRRRPAQEEPASPRRPRARHVRGAAAHPPRQPSRRGADCD